ncbi:LPD38 domain-containing protein [Pectinatus frisingensis]|uniref:LPD38 domain-containing protein n=1 Tax=Pectinatus frisingensis TaxID=865 RepID=UPI0018C57C9E|nr:LPD38 domain-containing protein [Pectinatus frisingensis]
MLTPDEIQSQMLGDTDNGPQDQSEANQNQGGMYNHQNAWQNFTGGEQPLNKELGDFVRGADNDTLKQDMESVNEQTEQTREKTSQFITNTVNDIENQLSTYASNAKSDLAAMFSVDVPDPTSDNPVPDIATYIQNRDAAQQKFVDREIKPILGAASFVFKPAAAVYLPFLGEDIYNSVKEKGALSTLRDFTYGQAKDFFSQPDLSEQFNEKPFTTTVQGAMSVLAPFLMGKSAVSWALRRNMVLHDAAKQAQTDPAGAVANYQAGNAQIYQEMKDATSAPPETQSIPTSDEINKSMGMDDIPQGSGSLADTIVNVSREENTDPNLMLAIAMRESGGDSVDNIKMSDGGGMFQLEPDTDIDVNGQRVKIADLYPDYQTDPVQNTKAAIAVLHDKIAQNDGDVWNGVKDYNGGGDPDYLDKVQSNYNSINGDFSGGDLETAASPWIGKTMNNGENGCVEAVGKIGSGYNEFLAEENRKGVVNVDQLVSDAGDRVIPFDENKLQKGDVIVYGDDEHVVVYDGKEGYFGNSTKLNTVVHGGDFHNMDGLEPTKIIKTPADSSSFGDVSDNSGIGSQYASDAEREAEKAQTESEQQLNDVDTNADKAWHETSDDYLKRVQDEQAQRESENKILDDEQAKSASDAVKNRTDDEILDDHKAIVEQALKDGEDVPDNVRAEYPDLMKEYGPQSGAAEFMKTPEGKDFMASSIKDGETYFDYAMKGDYAKAAEMARQAGDKGFADAFQKVVDTKGGTVPPKPAFTSVKTAPYSGKTITMPQILDRAQKLFVPVKTGHIGMKNVEGMALHDSGVVRTRDFGNLGVLSHEYGHIIDAALGLRSDAGAFDKEFGRVVRNRFGGAYKSSEVRGEGIAEFMHDYLTNEAKAKQEFPQYYKAFKEKLSQNPDMAGRIGELKSMIDTWQKQSPEARARGMTSFAGDEPKPAVKDRFQSLSDTVRKQWIDKLRGLEKVTAQAEAALEHKLPFEDNPYKQARLANTSPMGRTELLFGNGVKDVKTMRDVLNDLYDGKFKYPVTMKQIFDTIRDDKMNKKYPGYLKNGNFKDWQEALGSYLGVQRAVELHKAKFEVPLAEAKKSLSKATDTFLDAHKDYLDAVDRMKQNQAINKKSIRGNILIAKNELKQYQDLMKSFVSDMNKSHEDKGLFKGKIDSIGKEISSIEREIQHFQNVKESAQADKWVKIEKGNGSSSSISRLTGNVTLLKNIQTLAEKRLANAKTKLDSLKDKQPSVNGKSETTKSNYDETYADMQNAQKLYNEVLELKAKSESDNYYKNKIDVSAVEDAKIIENKAKLAQARAFSEVNRIKNEGYKTHVNMSDANTVIARAPKELKDAAEKTYQYQDNLLGIQQASGLISDKLADTLRQYKYYVPMAREFPEGGLGEYFGGTGKDIVNVSAVLKKLGEGGSTRIVKNPLEQIMANTYAVLNAAERNKVGQSLVRLGDIPGMGKFFLELPEKTGDAKESIFTVMFDGEKKAYQTTPEIYDAVKNLQQPSFNLFTKFFGIFSKALRIGATGVNPSFIVANVLRDGVTASVYDKSMIPLISTLKGVETLSKDTKAAMEFKASGAPMAALVGMDRPSIQSQIKILSEDGKISDAPKVHQATWLASKMVEAFRQVGETAENATRITAFENARKAGKSVSEAGLAAKESTVDFSRSGTLGQVANQFTAFFNANVQGLSRMTRAFEENPIGTSAGVTKWIILPTVALYALNYNQSWYQNLPSYQKDNNWVFSPDGGKHIIMIPKPQEVGVLFGSSIERSFDQFMGIDPKGVKRWLSDALSTLTPNILPTAIEPMVGWWANYNFFAGKPIVNERDSQYTPDKQYNVYTTEIAKKLGSLSGFSPEKIDYAIQGYLGGAGKFMSQLPNYVIGNHKTMPNRGVSDIPGVNRFMESGDFTQSQAASDFYDTYTRMHNEYNDVKAPAKQGQKAKVPVNIADINKAYKDITALNKANRNILNDDSMGADEKASKMAANNAKINEIAEKANKKYPPQ